MTLEWNKSYIELIALHVHPKNRNHLRSHLKAIMVVDHSILGLENKFLENKSGRIFLRSTSVLNKILPTNLGARKLTFYTFYTSHLRWNSTMRRWLYHIFINVQDDGSTRGLLAKPFKNFLKITYTASRFSLLTRAKFAVNINRVTLQHYKELIVFTFYLMSL